MARAGGNPDWKKGGKSPNPTGRTLTDRVSTRNLAIAIRELVSEEEIAMWLRMAAAGIDPDVKDPETGEPAWKTGRPGKGFVPLDWGQRLKAMQMLLERRDGQAPQHVTIEAEVKAHATMHGLALDLGKYSLEQLRSIRSILANPVASGGLPATAATSDELDALEPRVIDVK
jgi:hypothetical protein